MKALYFLNGVAGATAFGVAAVLFDDWKERTFAQQIFPLVKYSVSKLQASGNLLVTSHLRQPVQYKLFDFEYTIDSAEDSIKFIVPICGPGGRGCLCGWAQKKDNPVELPQLGIGSAWESRHVFRLMRFNQLSWNLLKLEYWPDLNKKKAIAVI